MMRNFCALLLLLLATSFASEVNAACSAPSCTIPNMNAGAAVSGTDLFPVYQGANPAVSVPASAIKTFVGTGLTCDAGFTAVLGQCVWTITASNSASLAWTGLTRDSYTMTCHGLTPVSATAFFNMQMGEGAGPTWHTGATDYNTQKIVGIGSAASAFGGTQPGVNIAFNPPNSGLLGVSVTASFAGLQSSENKAITIVELNMNSGNPVTTSGGGYDTHSAAVITAIRVIDTQATPGNISTGSCTLRENGT